MKRARKWMIAACIGATLLLGSGVVPAWAAPQEEGQRPAYTMAEYNAYQAAHNEQNPQQRVTLLDQFVAQYGNSALLPYIYRDYYLTYYALKNYPKTIEYVDNLLALGDKIDRGTKLEALVARAQSYFAGSSDAALQTPEALQKTLATAREGISTLAEWQKPQNMTDEQFANQRKSIGLLFNSVAGIAQSQLKDYAGAAASYRAALALEPNDAVTHYRLGVTYLQQSPPQHLQGFWELARAIALNVQGDAQVRSYLRNQILAYQQPACDRLVDEQVNELITLAGTSQELPSTLVIPSADDLARAREDVANFLPALREGGNAGKTMWLATCGLEYPDVPVRVMAVEPGEGDSVTLKVFRAPTEEEMKAATEPNMEVHIVGQPEARRIPKDDYVRFTATLTGYQQTPFLLTWDQGRVNPEDLVQQ